MHELQKGIYAQVFDVCINTCPVAACNNPNGIFCCSVARTVDPKRKKVAESEKNLRLAQTELARIKVCPSPAVLLAPPGRCVPGQGASRAALEIVEIAARATWVNCGRLRLPLEKQLQLASAVTYSWSQPANGQVAVLCFVLTSHTATDWLGCP